MMLCAQITRSFAISFDQIDTFSRDPRISQMITVYIYIGCPVKFVGSQHRACYNVSARKWGWTQASAKTSYLLFFFLYFFSFGNIRTNTPLAVLATSCAMARVTLNNVKKKMNIYVYTNLIIVKTWLSRMEFAQCSNLNSLTDRLKY